MEEVIDFSEVDKSVFMDELEDFGVIFGFYLENVFYVSEEEEGEGGKVQSFLGYIFLMRVV